MTAFVLRIASFGPGAGRGRYHGSAMTNLPAPATPPPGARESAASPVRSRVRTALIIAIAADTVQLALLPLFGGGILSPFNNALDVVIGLVLVRLVGWHFAFLPTFVAELVPGLDLFPSWTAAVWFVTRGRDQGLR
jgi:hypothetical protein